MTTTPVNPEVKDAALIGAIAILLQPEYGDEWIINDVLRDAPKELITDENVEQIDTLIMQRFREFAKSLASELPAEKLKGLEFLAE